MAHHEDAGHPLQQLDDFENYISRFGPDKAVSGEVDLNAALQAPQETEEPTERNSSGGAPLCDKEPVGG
jgi:hypothetical protein